MKPLAVRYVTSRLLFATALALFAVLLIGMVPIPTHAKSLTIPSEQMSLYLPNVRQVGDGDTISIITGYVQKGPFIQGTELTLRELDDSLTPTGRSFATTISDNTGSFSVVAPLQYQFVEVSASGFYFNEVTGVLSAAPINLRAVVDLRIVSSIKVNVLTHLEYSRVLYLADSGLTLAQAKDQAQREILNIFNIDSPAIDTPETLDISQDGDGNAILLAISAILQSDRTEAQLTELLANISSDIRIDGRLDGATTRQALLAAMEYIRPLRTIIRNNIADRYAALDVPANIPAFERFAFNLDTVPPTVTSISPGEGIHINVDTMSISFSELIEHSTVTSETVRLTDSNGSQVSASFNVVDSNGITSTIIFSPSTPLLPGIYTLTIDTAVHDYAGNGIPARLDLSFTKRLPTVVLRIDAHYHTCALTVADGMYCWGPNGNGQLGDGTTIDRLIPTYGVKFPADVQDFVTGGFHTCALNSIGGVKCWGLNRHGMLGDGTNGGDSDNILTPVDVAGLDSGVLALTANEYHACVLTNAGGVKCWGWNRNGQLGNNAGGNERVYSATPVDVVGLTSGVRAISAGGGHTCALMVEGTVKCWGDNSLGQLGDGSKESHLTPVDVVGLPDDIQAISTGHSHTCALTSSGGVKCWGNNAQGQVGDNTGMRRSTPVDVVGLSSGVQAITAGSVHTCALTTDGGVKCWGSNGKGQLGDGTGGQGFDVGIDKNRRLKPVDVVGLSSGIQSVVAGNYHTCALTDTGSVKCWGYGSSGALGDNSNVNRNIPVDVVWR